VNCGCGSSDWKIKEPLSSSGKWKEGPGDRRRACWEAFAAEIRTVEFFGRVERRSW
jgi:hypothetical protein